MKIVLVVASLISVLFSGEPPRAVMSEEAENFIIDYCFDCHDSSLKKGRVDLEELNLDLGKDLHTAAMWQEILDVVNSGEMPPKKKLQPEDMEKASFLEELSNKMVDARKIHAEDGGRVTLRRLNRREYANTLEALTGVRVPVDNLPSDANESGFDTSGSSLFMSSGQFEQYLEIGLKALKLGSSSTKPVAAKVIHIEAEKAHGKEWLQKNLDKYIEEVRNVEAYVSGGKKDAEKYGLKPNVNVNYRLRMAKQLIAKHEELLAKPEIEEGIVLNRMMETQGTHQIHMPTISPNPNQTVKLRIRGAAYHDVDPRFNYVEITARNQKTQVDQLVATVKFTAPIDSPEIIEIPVKVEHGQAFSFNLHLRSYFKGSGSDLGMIYGKGGVCTPFGVWLDWVEIDLSRAGSGYTPQLGELLLTGADQSDQEYAKEVISKFTKKAFRTHEADSEYKDKLLNIFLRHREEGLTRQEAILHPMALALTSPSFLYMRETSSSKRVNPFELAVRLSYFLWSSPPDEELLSLAESGKLRTPKILFDQVDRMLADPKAMNFIEGFCFQWLGMDRLGLFPFDANLHKGFDKAVVYSAKKEIYAMLKYVITENLPIRELLNSDHVLADHVLVDHYGFTEQVGGSFERIKVPEGEPRGGLLGTAAFLAMGSDGKVSSPIERGVWVLKHLLGQSPPPAPPNVPQIDRVKTDFISNREVVKLHREAPQCAQCHDKIDPLGMGFEQFDAAGRWRTHEEVVFNKKTKELPLDPSGKLPSGERFNDFYELRSLLADKDEAFARVIVEELISYGLGRSFQFVDEENAQQILEKSSGEGYRFKELLKRVILSSSFQTK